jgi:hypothetical protein
MAVTLAPENIRRVVVRDVGMLGQDVVLFIFTAVDGTDHTIPADAVDDGIQSAAVIKGSTTEEVTFVVGDQPNEPIIVVAPTSGSEVIVGAVRTGSVNRSRSAGADVA